MGIKMITGAQIRAARGLLSWSREDLATVSKVTAAAIKNIEDTPEVRPQVKTAEAITSAFAAKGVEFTERGVAWVDDLVRKLEGENCYLRLIDEVYQELHNQPKAEVLSICTDDAVSPDHVVQAIKRWHDAGIKCRFLTHENSERFDFPLKEYRLIPERFYKNSVMVVYADKVATLSAANDAVIIVRDKDQADMMRGLFEMIWLQSPMPKADK